MKRILVPTDFSDNARNAFEYAVKLFGIENCEYILLNAFSTPTAGGGMLVSLDEVLEKEGMKDLKREKIKLEAEFSDVNITLRCKHGELDNVIRRTNIEEKVDYVVMGTHGASGIQKVMVGSNAQRVISNVVRPVLAVPENGTCREIKKIGFAVDLKKIENRETLKPIVELAKETSASVLLMHVVSDREETLSMEEEGNRLQLEALFDSVPHSYHIEVNEDIVEGINEFVDAQQIDILAMVPRKASFLESFFKSSITKEVNFQANIPLLAIKDLELE